MKSERFLHPATCFFLLTGLVTFVSWVGTVYEWPGVRSLLGDEGLRWSLRTWGRVYFRPPVLPVILVLSLGAGLWTDSGLGKACRLWFGRREMLSRKERRALTSAVVALAVYLCALLVLIGGPWDVSSSVVGTFRGSPLADGIWCVVSAGIAFPSVVYGFASDTYLTDRDVVAGMASLIVRKAGSFVTLFFVLLFFASLEYTGLAGYMGVPPEVMDWICVGCCLILWVV